MCVFEKSKMFYPPEGLCRAEPKRGPIVFTLHFIGVRRGTGGFKFWAGNPPFWKPADVLSPGGTLQCRARKGSNCFYFTFYWCRKRYWGVSKFALVICLFENPPMFYPPEGLCSAEPERGPIVFTLHLIGVGRGTGGFNFSGGNPPFWNLENVLSPGGTLLSRARKGSNCFYLYFIPLGVSAKPYG